MDGGGGEVERVCFAGGGGVTRLHNVRQFCSNGFYLALVCTNGLLKDGNRPPPQSSTEGVGGEGWGWEHRPVVLKCWREMFGHEFTQEPPATIM